MRRYVTLPFVMANQQDLQAFLVMASGLDMHFEDQRAGGVENEHIARFGRRRDSLGDAVC